MPQGTRSPEGVKNPGPLTRSHLGGSSGVFVPLAVIRMTGDPAAAILFGQLLWWLTQAEHPKTKDRGGYTWLIKPHGAWQSECGLTVDQARGAVKRLVTLGLVEQSRWKHDGAPTTHLRVCWDALENVLSTTIHSASDPNGNGESGRSMDSVDSPNPPLSETEETTDLTPPPPDGDGTGQIERVPDPVSLALCEHLADRIEANGSKRPKITPAWLDSARRMVERDGRDPVKAHRLIDWCQDDEFEAANVLSMPKFRARYDQLRLKANRSVKANKPRETIGQSKARRALERAAAMRAAEGRELSA